MKLNHIHHVAVICSDYCRSKRFYTEVLGLKIRSEHYRSERDSWKADCYLGDTYVVELFSFPTPPARHIAHEPVRTDEYTHKPFLFFSDPDGLPIELYEK